jgi:hypothetical protein
VGIRAEGGRDLEQREKAKSVIARESGRSSIPEMSVMESRGRGVLDGPLKPVIGLAEGETRWRGMTTSRMAGRRASTD